MKNNKKFPLLKILQSVFSALLGVQSNKNMQQDFETGKIHHYIIVGLIIVSIILVLLYIIVRLVIAN